MPFAAVAFDQLLEVAYVSLLAGVGVTVLFSLVIYGSARATDARRDGNGAVATLFGVLAGVALSAVAAGVLFAMKVILDKG